MPGFQSSLGLEEGDKIYAYKSVIKQKVRHDTNDLEIKGNACQPRE